MTSQLSQKDALRFGEGLKAINLGNDSSRRDQTDFESTADTWWYRRDGSDHEDGRGRKTLPGVGKQVRFDGRTRGERKHKLFGAEAQLMSGESSSSRRLGLNGCEEQFDMLKDDRKRGRTGVGGEVQ